MKFVGAHVSIAGGVQNAPENAAEIGAKGYFEAGDAVGLERQAHSIKSAAANVGGKRLQEEAAALEKVANGGDLSAVTLRMVELEAQFAALRKAMTEGRQ